jgi:hypothetical protein
MMWRPQDHPSAPGKGRHFKVMAASTASISVVGRSSPYWHGKATDSAINAMSINS